MAVRELRGFFQKGRGLLGTGSDATPVLLRGCSSVHTFGMAYALDLAFVDGAGTVLRSCENVGPGRIRTCGAARCVIERPHATSPWLKRGMRLALVSVNEEKEMR